MLRIDITQPVAFFRIATIGNPLISYPLVPPSTFFGFLRKATGVSIDHRNTKIAISGYYSGKAAHIVRNSIITRSDTSYKPNIILTEDLFDMAHCIHLESPEYEEIIMGSITNAYHLGRSENIITSIECEKAHAEEYEPADLKISDLENPGQYNMYALPECGNGSPVAFNVSMDCDKDLLERGIRKMYRKQLIYLSAWSFRKSMWELRRKVMASNGNGGKKHIFQWIN